MFSGLSDLHGWMNSQQLSNTFQHSAFSVLDFLMLWLLTQECQMSNQTRAAWCVTSLISMCSCNLVAHPLADNGDVLPV